MFSVHTTPEEFKNEGFTLKTHQMFSVHTMPEEFKNGGFTLKTLKVNPPFSNFSGVVWTENIWCVFRVKPPFSNFSGIVWTGPKTKGVEILAREEQIITKWVALRCDQCYRISIANFFLSVQYTVGFFSARCVMYCNTTSFPGSLVFPPLEFGLGPVSWKTR